LSPHEQPRSIHEILLSSQLFGKREAYTKEIRKVDLERLAHLIKVCGFLMQTKVHLFWKKKKGIAYGRLW
jgi:hypothetical protein